MKSFNGCWTCRLRHKKCDERHPVCGGCAALHITCHYSLEKPEWMDGGARQNDMAERLKRQVKENSHQRYANSAVHVVGNGLSTMEAATGGGLAAVTSDIPCHARQGGMHSTSFVEPQQETVNVHKGSTFPGGQVPEWSDTILFTFYLEHLFPFLFPFYRPSPLQGGKAWIFEMMIRRPVVRQTILCQSSYFFTLAQDAASRSTLWETMLGQTKDAFTTLRQALQVIYAADISDHLHGAVRIMASIMQLQRFEIAVWSFGNCRAHLNAALTLFEQIVNSVNIGDVAERFRSVMDRLRRAPRVLSTQCFQIPSAEQAAFQFSTSLLVFDDIIASTMTQEQPRLYRYHHNLLDSVDEAGPLIDLETVTGCRNWVLVCVSEIAVLDAWKQRRRGAGNLDAMELVYRATPIKASLEARLVELRLEQDTIRNKGSSFLDFFDEQLRTPIRNSSLVTQIWAHAALIYLSVVVSGWQTANPSLRYHVYRVIEMMTSQVSPPAMLRSMLWPFFVAGCLAESAQEARIRAAVKALQPSSLFGTVHKALHVMEDIWRNRNAEDVVNRDLANCFRSQDDLVLFV